MDLGHRENSEVERCGFGGKDTLRVFQNRCVRSARLAQPRGPRLAGRHPTGADDRRNGADGFYPGGVSDQIKSLPCIAESHFALAKDQSRPAAGRVLG